ncbi:MAG: hypothetical protein RIS44_3052 [Pseudomonadota bacterium]|jgi:hypothetical protein
MSQVLRPQPFLPAPRTQSNGAGASEGRDAAALAWQREMERAQMTQWFHASKTRVVATPAPARTEDVARPPEPAVGTSVNEVKKSKVSSPVVQGADRPSSTAQSTGSLSTSDVRGESLITPPMSQQVEPGDAKVNAVSVESASGAAVPMGSPGAAYLAKSTPPLELSTDIFSVRHSSVQSDAPAMSSHQPSLDVAVASRLQVAPVSDSTAPSGPVLDTASDESPQTVHNARHQQTPRSGAVDASALLQNSGLAEIRCHAQWTAQGVNVWLGMDASVQEQTRQLGWIISQLQQSLRQQGHVLGAVVCNGRTVFQGDVLASDQTAFRNARDTTIQDLPSFTLGAYKTLFQQE